MAGDFVAFSEEAERRFYCRMLAEELLQEAGADHRWLTRALTPATRIAVLADAEAHLLDKHKDLSIEELYCLVAGSFVGKRLLAREVAHQAHADQHRREEFQALVAQGLETEPAS